MGGIDGKGQGPREMAGLLDQVMLAAPVHCKSALNVLQYSSTRSKMAAVRASTTFSVKGSGQKEKS